MFLSLEDKTPEHMGNRVARSTSQGRFAWMLDKMRKSHPSKKCRETVFSCFFSKEKHQSSLIGSQVSNLPKSKKICSFPTSPQKKCVAKVPQLLVCIYRIYIYIYIYIHIYILYTLYIYIIIYIYIIHIIYIYNYIYIYMFSTKTNQFLGYLKT